MVYSGLLRLTLQLVFDRAFLFFLKKTALGMRMSFGFATWKAQRN